MAAAQSRTDVDAAAVLRAIMASMDRDAAGACARARTAARDYPDFAPVYRVLAFALRRVGNRAEAERMELRAVQVGLDHPDVAQAQRLLAEGKLEEAEMLIRSHLRRDPEDAGAAFILGEIATRCDAIPEAENLLRRAFGLATAYIEPRVALAKMLNGSGRYEEALTILDEILTHDRKNLFAMSMKAGIFSQYRRFDEADIVFKRLLRSHPEDARGWMNYAYLLKTTGRTKEAVAAYREAVKISPTGGGSWWGLANLKTVEFERKDIEAMLDALQRSDVSDEDRIHLHFAAGKALGDRQEFSAAFEQYAAGSVLRRTASPHDAGQVHDIVLKVEKVFSPAFLSERRGLGCLADDPIFIVSLPRSGSTLVEQILASHPMIEGTEELFDIERMALELAPGEAAGSYLSRISELGPDKLRLLGEQYMEATRRVRHGDHPFFTDKMPSNWAFTGLIHLILPNARIIDVRRHPLGCGLANFAQHYNWGINFSYDLADIGRFYSDYVRQMSHFDKVLPKKIHRIFYEDLVDNLEGEVRRLLNYLGLPFDSRCLDFHENKRAVHTPSSQQVRRPINRLGMDTWRSYEPWLDPLKDMLGPVLQNYPAVPAEWPNLID